METNYKITIPKPCHEDWEKMTPNRTGRFCNSCVKSVVDFTNMEAAEIQEYFIKSQGQKVCGRFKNEQLDSVIIQIPRRVLFSQIQFHKIFVLALLISMPELLMCQTKNGNSKKIDKVEIVSSKKDSSMIAGRAKVDERFIKDEAPMTPERKARIEELQRKREEIKKRRESSKKKNSDSTVMNKPPEYLTGDVAILPENPPETPKNSVYTTNAIQVMPAFPGGITKFYDYFNSRFKMPEGNKDMTGKLIFSFIVDTDGSLTDIKLLRGVNSSINEEAVKVLKSSPKWIPGEQDGKKVKVLYSIPIKITAQ